MKPETVHNSLPNRRMEAWKWTDLYGKTPGSAQGLTLKSQPAFDCPKELALKQVQGAEQLLRDTDQRLPMAALAAQLNDKIWTLSLPKNSAPSRPLVITHMEQGHGRITLNLEPGSHLTLIEHYQGKADGFSNLIFDIEVGKNASLTRVIIQDDPDSHMRVSTARIVANDNSKIQQYSLSTGAAISRLETHIYGQGHDIEANVHGAYMVSNQRHCDLTSVVHLDAPNARVQQSIKGVVTDQSRGVFQGKFQVTSAAQHTDANMRHDVLMLSDEAQVRSKPELEIYADDVACSHGNTVGNIDSEALFYMRQRGIDEAQAKAMLTHAFVSSVFDDMEDTDIQRDIFSKITHWLEQTYAS